jgi:hypothetical protein
MDQLRLPDDPTGIAEAHDILAADEFAMPSGPDSFGARVRGGGAVNPLVVLVAAALAAVVIAALRRR